LAHIWRISGVSLIDQVIDQTKVAAMRGLSASNLKLD
jgi:hypothetical protein